MLKFVHRQLVSVLSDICHVFLVVVSRGSWFSIVWVRVRSWKKSCTTSSKMKTCLRKKIKHFTFVWIRLFVLFILRRTEPKCIILKCIRDEKIHTIVSTYKLADYYCMTAKTILVDATFAFSWLIPSQPATEHTIQKNLFRNSENKNVRNPHFLIHPISSPAIVNSVFFCC